MTDGPLLRASCPTGRPSDGAALRLARGRVLLAAALAFVAATAAGAERWTTDPDGTELSADWRVDRSPETRGTLAVKDGALVITAEEARFHHVERELRADGTDAAPLRVECGISSGFVHPPLPTLLCLYWDAGTAFGVGPTFLTWHEQGAAAQWVAGGQRGASGVRTSLGRWATLARFRIVVTSRDISAFASRDGVRFTRVASVTRGKGRFEGPPRLLVVGRGWFGDGKDCKPDLDNDVGNIYQRDLRTFSFSPVSVRTDVPRVPEGAPPGYEKLDDWDATLKAWRARGIPKQWWLLGPLEPRKEPWGPESKVDLEQKFKLQAGVDYYVQIPNGPALENVQESDYTLAAWVRPGSVPSGKTNNEKKYAIVAKQGWHIGLLYTTEAKFETTQVLDDSSTLSATSERAFPPGEWRHVAGVVSWTGRAVRTYVDGRLEAEVEIPEGRKSREYEGTPWRIGIGHPGAGDWRYALDGAVDDVRVYAKALSGDEVAALASGASAPEIVVAVADDPDDADTALGAGDTITVVFDVPTNTPPVRTRGEIDGLIDFGGRSPGRRYRGEWRDDRTLVVTVEDGRGGRLAPGDRMALKADGRADLLNRAKTSGPSRAQAAVSGDWGEPVPEGLAGWWKLDDGAGSKARDSSGKGNDGAIRRQGSHGKHAWQPGGGRTGGSLKFEFWDDPHSNRTEGYYVEVADSPGLNPTGAVTVMTWANATRWGNYGFYWPGLVRKEGQYSLDSREVNRLRFHVWLPSGIAFVECATPSAGDWHHLAGVYDGRRIRLYVDGKLAAEKEATGALAVTENALHLGTRLGNEHKFYDGQLDDARVYARALGEEEIAALSRVDVPRGALVGCWQLDEKEGEVALDSSGLDNHGKVVGGERVAGRVGGAMSFHMRDGSWVLHERPKEKPDPVVSMGSVLKAAGQRSTGFAYARVVADEAGRERFHFDGERWAELYVNGALVASCESAGGSLIPDRVAAEADLAKGENHVVLKLTRERSGWRFTFRREPADPGRRVALLRRLVADFPGETARVTRARFDIAAIWEDAGFLRRASEVLAEVAGVDGATAEAVEDAVRGRVRLFTRLRDHRAAAAELRRVIASLREGSSERLEFTLDLVRALVRAGDDRGAEAIVAELGKGRREHAARARGVLAASYEERGDQAKRLAQLKAILAEGEGDAPDDSLHVEYAEAILAPVRRAYGEGRRLDASAVREALSHYRKAVALLPTREHRSVVPLVEKADAAVRRRDWGEALGLLPAAYFRAWMVRSKVGGDLVRSADEVEIAPPPPPKSEKREWKAAFEAARAGLAKTDQVTDWYAVGAFDNTNWKAYGAPYVDPANVDVTKPVRGKKWRRLGPDAYARGYLDMGKLQDGQWIVGYLYTEIESATERETELRIGADDGCTVWLNGRKVHEDRVQRGLTPDGIVIPVRLRKGRNAVLARVQNGSGPWAFMMRVTTTPYGSQDFVCYLHMLDHCPEHHAGLAEAFRGLAHSFLDRQRQDAGLAVLRAVARAFPDRPDVVVAASARAVDQALYRNANPAFAAGTAAWAEAALERRGLARGDEVLRDVRARGARALAAVGDLAGAADRLRAVIRSDPRSDSAARAFLALAEIQRDAGLRRAAASSYEGVLATGVADDQVRALAHRRLAEVRRTRGETVAFDASFEAATFIRTGDRAARRGDVERALQCYQEALDRHGNALFRLSDAKLVGVAEYCADRVRALAAEGRAAYRKLFDGRAASLRRMAEETGDPARFLELARAYPFSSHGDDALNRVGNLDLERGRPESAARAFRRVLEDHPDTDLDRALLLAKLAFAEELAGDARAAERALDRLVEGFGGGKVTVSGVERPVRWYAGEARRRLRAPSARDAGTDGWPTWGGSARREGRSRASPDPAPCRLEVRFPEGPADAVARDRFWPSPHRHVSGHAAVADGRAYFATLEEVFAVDLATGRLEWRSAAPFAALLAPGSARGFAGMPDAAVTVRDGRVHARVLRRSGLNLSEVFTIQALDARTGELLWSTESAGGLEGMTAVTPPCAAGGAVFALFRDTGESQRIVAVAIDAAAGDVLWRTPLVSGFAEVELSREETVYVGDHGAAPSAAGGDVYFSTDLGAVAALDAATGAVRWIADCPRARFDAGRSGRERHLLASRASSRVVVGDDALYVASRDALAVLRVARANGDVVWSRDLADCRLITGLVPADTDRPGRLVIQGTAVECLDASSGSRLWRWEPPPGAGAVFGAAALGGGHVYVPTELGLYRIGIADGRTADERTWESLSLARPVGNLVLLRDAILGLDGSSFVRLGGAGRERLARVDIPGAVVRDETIPSAGFEPGEQLRPPLAAVWRLGREGVGIRRPAGAPPEELYVETGDALARVDAAGARVVWRTHLAGSPSSFAWSKDLVVAAYPKRLVALDRGRGGALWTHWLTPDASGYGFDTADARGFGEVVAGTGFVAARQQDSPHVHVMDSGTGRRKRRLGLTGVHCMLAAGGALVTGVEADGRFAAEAWDPATGKPLWREEMPVRAEGHRRVFSDGGDDLLFYGDGRLCRFDVRARKVVFNEPLKPLAEPRFGFEAGYVTLLGKEGHDNWRSIAVDAATGRAVFEERAWGGDPWHAGRPYSFAPGRAVLTWRHGESVGIVCRAIPGAKELWKVEQKCWDWPVAGGAAGGSWLQVYGRELARLTWDWRLYGLAYRAFDLETGRLVGEGDLPGTPDDVRGLPASLVGERLLYVAREGVFAAAGLPQSERGASLEAAVDRARGSAPGRPPREREGAAEFVAVSARNVRRAFVSSQDIRVDGRLDDWAGIEAVPLSEPIGVRSEGPEGWSGPEDLSALARVAWDAERVYVSVDVTDDVHAPPVPGADLITGDSIVVGVDPKGHAADRPDERLDIVLRLALVGGRPVMRQMWGPLVDAPGRPPEETPGFHAVRSAHGAVYELSLPWQLLRPSPDERPGKAQEMGLAVAVFDRDGPAPEGALEWGAGLVRGIRPRAFGRVRFIDITPRRIAQYRRFMELMPSHPLCRRFLSSIGEAQDDRSTLGNRIAELERFLKLKPGRANAVPALAELVRRYRERGDPDAAKRAPRFAAEAGVDAATIADVVRPARGREKQGRYVRQWVWLDPAEPPETVMLQFRSKGRDWAHRACWGADRIPWGRSGTPERWPMGPLPPKGKWVELVVPVGLVGIDGQELTSVGFTAFGGRVHWDRTEYVHDGTATVLIDDELPAGGRFEGQGKPRWAETPRHAGARAHTDDVVDGLTEYHVEGVSRLFDTRLPEAKEDAAARKARLELYVEAASLIPENEEALELLREAEALHDGLPRDEHLAARAAMYEDLLRSSPGTPQAYRVLLRLRDILGNDDAAVARCEAVMDDLRIAREQRRLFYSAWAPTIQKWKLLGYLNPGSDRRNLEKELRPERFPVRLNASYESADGAEITWRDVESRWHSVDMWDFLRPEDGTRYGVAYLYTRVESPRAQKVLLVIGSRHGCVVWLNGKRVGTALWSEYRRDQHKLPVQLKEGLNDVLLKLTHSGGWGQMSCRIADQNGRPLDDVTLSLPVSIVSAAGGVDPDRVTVAFSEKVDRASAETLANYGVSGGVTVASASLGGDGTTVALSTSQLVRNARYELTVGGVKSAASALRGVERGSKRPFAVMGNGTGLTAKYYNKADFTAQAFTRVDPVVNNDWGERSPEGLDRGDFSIVWTGFVEPLFSEEYTFHTISDDGVRLWVGGQPLVDNWTGHGATEDTGTIRLEAFKRHEVKLEYYQGWGLGCIRLLWSSRSQNREVIPQAQLFPEN